MHAHFFLSHDKCEHYLLVSSGANQSAAWFLSWTLKNQKPFFIGQWRTLEEELLIRRLCNNRADITRNRATLSFNYNHEISCSRYYRLTNYTCRYTWIFVTVYNSQQFIMYQLSWVKFNYLRANWKWLQINWIGRW